MPRRTSQRSLPQSLVIVIALLLLFGLAVVIAVRGIAHGAPDPNGDAAGLPVAVAEAGAS